MDVITTVLGTGAWLVGVALLVVMAMLPWLERMGTGGESRVAGGGGHAPVRGEHGARRCRHRGAARGDGGGDGAVGIGESTLLHCLAGILRPAEGEVWLGADRIDGWSEARRTALRGSRLGFVFQFGQLLPELPAVENVALPLMLGGMRRAEAVQRAAAWFGPLGLDGLADRRPGQLSGGQEQRAAIARALVTSPDVVFADEPTGALDTDTGHRIMALLRELVTRTGTGLVVVTHEAEMAASCHRTVALRDGRTVEPLRSDLSQQGGFPPVGPQESHPAVTRRGTTGSRV